ncbi:MAG: hypothetical protein OEW35_22345, partial [Gammaproteobacteria bacterium]|nr:hypothetical protein [Gammaproteobacteria bacterium]
PAYLLVIFVGFCWNNIPQYFRSAVASGDPAVLYAWLVILGSIALLLTVTAIGTRRWRAAGLDIDGKGAAIRPPGKGALT